MKPKSAIAKGKRLEKDFMMDVRQSGIDPNARRNPGSGNGLAKSDVYIPRFNLHVECKNTKNFGIGAWKQAMREAVGPYATPMALWKPPYSSTEDSLCVLRWCDLKNFLKMIK
uniref:VRR-NUC domain-containing protein n=1 Tax=viral metagenome TaxID=1070528 RepID=A0A6H1ZE10_9ZZZZ